MFKEIPADLRSKSNRRPVYGVGINDSSYQTQPVIDGKKVMCPYYSTWRGMISRCYDPKQSETHPTYKGCSVADDWIVFSEFKAWMESQDWVGKHLDKDIMVPGNKIYSADTCMFVSAKVNTLLNYNSASKGKYPTGVCYHKPAKRYIAMCQNGEKYVYLGLHDTPEQAEIAYINFKSKHIIKIANEQTDIRVKKGLLKHAELLVAGLPPRRKVVRRSRL